MKMKRAALISVASIVPTIIVGNAMAEEGALVWSGDAELGYVSTNGNTKTQTINAKMDATRDNTHWRHNAKLNALNTSEEETTSAEKYTGDWKTDFKLDTANFLFVSLNYEDDRFSGFDYQSTLAAGYGRHLIETDKTSLEVEAGPGYRYSKLKVEVDGEDAEDEAILKLAGKYRYKFTKTSQFMQDLVFDVGSDSTVTKSVTAVKAQIVGELAMKASYTVKHTSEVPLDTDKTDSETALTLVYSF